MVEFISILAHGIDHVGVRRRHERFGVEPLLPDRQNIVAHAERLLRSNLHAEGIDQRERLQVDLHGALEQQLILE
jgi:hypothetical protein